MPRHLDHWTLLGCGALGGVLAGLLAQAGNQVSLLRTNDAAVRLPLLLTWWDLQGQQHSFEPDFLQAKDAANIRLLLVTTKAYQVQSALEPLVGVLPSATPILLLHNGMGTESWVHRAFPDNPILLAVTSNGALRLGNEEFRHTGAGETWIGPANEAARHWQPLAELLARALPHAGWSEEIRLRQWEKLVINAIINPLTALSGERNGSLLARQYEVEALCEELLPLLQRHGLSGELAFWRDKVLNVARLTADNFSSMHQDLDAGRDSEIDYITGFLLREAQEAQLHLPLHQQLYQAIKAKERT